MDRYYQKRTAWGTRWKFRIVVLFFIVIMPLVIVITVVQPKEEETGTQYWDTDWEETEYFAVCEREAGNISVPVEVCLISLLSNHMEADAPEEALCAMAILLRTQAVYEIETYGSTIAEGYRTDAQLKELWGDQYETYYEIYAGAVSKSTGIIMTHDGRPIETAFHQISAGRTRDASVLQSGHELFWKTIKCEQDMMADHYRTVVNCDASKLKECLKSLTGSDSIAGVQIVIEERDEAGYVLAISIEGDDFDGLLIGGERFRAAFQLPSSSFTVEQTEDGVRFICFGLGHGYGMSLHQAKALAKEGKDCMNILKYFFKEIEFMRIA